jgi:N-acyl homoserine lactone hydrolase
VRVHPLRTAILKAWPGFLERPGGPLWLPRGLGLHRRRSTWHSVPIPAFLIEHPTAGPVLVDTGYAASVAADGRGNLGPVFGSQSIEMKPEWAVPAQLRERGIEPSDVGVVLMTHLHYDHTSGLSEFGDSTFVVDRREWAAAARGGWLHGYVARMFDHPFDWRTLDFEAVGVDSVATFGRAFDVFGDGSVHMLSTPGHTLGHCSLLLRLSGGRELLLTGDASFARRTIDEELLPLFFEDEHLYRRSLREIRRYVELTPDAVVICGHDEDNWPKLAPIYE